MSPETKRSARGERWRQGLVYFGLAREESAGPPQKPAPTRPLALAFTAIALFTVFVVSWGVTSGHWRKACITGLVTTVVILWSGEARRRRGQVAWEASERGQPLPTPALAGWWSRRTARTRTALAVAAVVFVAFFFWAGLMGLWQDGTCDRSSGGLLSRQQHGFTRVYCGIDGASSSGVVLDWLLVLVLPLVGLATGVVAVTVGRRRVGTLLAVGGAAIVLPMLLAWVLAGAHPGTN